MSMLLIRRPKRDLASLIAMMALGIGSAHADLIEYSFNTPSGERRTVPADQQYVNPVGTIQFALSAGLDRYVRATILDERGRVVSTNTSHLLSARDRIDVNGQSTYGAVIDVPAPAEGEYTVRAEILSASKEVVQTDTYPLVVDVTPPTIGGKIQVNTIGGETSGVGLGRYGGLNLTTDSHSGALVVTNVKDNFAVDEAYLNAYYEEGSSKGNLLFQQKVSYSESTQQINHPFSFGGRFPNNREDYKLEVIVKDKAGNTSAPVSVVTGVETRSCAILPEPVAMYKPGYEGSYMGQQGYIEWKQGDPIYTNPYRSIWRIPKSETYPENKYGYLNTPFHTDDQYAYYRSNPKHNVHADVSGAARFHTTTQWSCMYGVLSGPLDAGVMSTPLLTSVRYRTVNDPEGVFPRTGDVWASSLEQYPHQFEIRANVLPEDNKVAVGKASCVIPAGESRCIANNTFKPTSGASREVWRFTTETKSFGRTQDRYINYSWNFDPIRVESYEYDSKNKQYKTLVHDPRAYISSNQFYYPVRAKLTLQGDKGKELVFEQRNSGSRVSHKEFLYSMNLSSVPDGYYDIGFEVVSRHNLTTSKNLERVLIDNTPPTVESNIQDGAFIESLDDIYFTIKDNYDPNVFVRSVTLQGGANDDNVDMGSSNRNGRVRIEYPVLFPSLEEGKEYKLTLVAEDHQGNATAKTVTFNYGPPEVAVTGQRDGKLWIPAVAQEFTRTDSTPALITEPLALGDGTIVHGTYNIQATLGTDSELPVKINGVTVSPGETLSVASNYDFSNSNGRILLPIQALTDSEGGHVSLLLSTDAPNSPIAVVNLQLWKPSVDLVSPTWEYRQVIDALDIKAQPSEGSACMVTVDEVVAKRSDPFAGPVCLLEWVEMPDSAILSRETANGLRVAGLRGEAVALGEQNIKYNLFMYSGAGQKIKVGEGEKVINVVSAADSVALDANLPTEALIRKIDDINIRPRQTEGPTCSFTLDKDQALRSSSLGISEHSKTCWFEWSHLPDGVDQDEYTSIPLARGMFQEVGSHDIGWRVSIFSRTGEQVVLADQVTSIEAVNPPFPDITLSSPFLLNEDEKVLIVPLNEMNLGEVSIQGKRASIDIEINRDSESLYAETLVPGYGYSGNVINRRLPSPSEKKLWETTDYTVKSTYTDIPDVSITETYTAYSTPITGAKPFISSPNEYALNTDTLPIHVDILDQYSHRDPYNAETMGEWRTRVLRIMPSGELEAVSDWTSMSNGHAEFDVDISEIADVRTLRFTAESELIHSIDGYNRVEQSPRVLFLSLLRGEAIDAEITTRTISGPAPLRGSFKVDLADRTMMSSTGDIVWERSTDGGATWEQHVPDERYKFIYNETFDTGTYHLRALVTNKNSGVQSYTEQIEVIAYDKPELQIEGPTIRFVGDEVTLTANAGYESMVDGERIFTPINQDDTVIEWSIDGGRNYEQTGPTLTLSSDTQKRIMIAARVRTTHAPEEDRYAYNVKKTSIEFKPIRAPRVRVTGPSLVEVGKTYEFKAVKSLPYRGMGDTILGYFTLPNGEQVHGDVLTYTPTDEDLVGGRMAIRYDAWIEGYEDQGTEATHTLRSSIWKYVWPDFAMHYQANATVAPALVTMTIRPLQAVGNRLEEPKYEWVLPEQIEMIDNSRDITRKFRVLEPGDHMVTVRITDARGHEALVEYPISLAEAIPFTLDLELSPDNAGFREPLSLIVRPRISGGHPRDRFDSFEFTVDGETVDSLNRYAKIDLDKGIYNIGVTMTSQMGVVTQESVNVEVFENQVPICTVSQRESITAFVYTADCVDPDGRLRGYDWQLGDRELVSGSRSITVGKHRLEGVTQIILVGIDDSGGRSEPVIIPVNFSMEQEDGFSESVTN